MGKPQIIRFDQSVCNADIDDNNVLFVRVSGRVTQKDALIEVPFTHNAYVIKGGGDGTFYKSGTYPIFDGRSDIKNLKRGYSVDIVYMPKDTNVVILWGTPDKIVYHDKALSRDMEIAARGSFGIAITNPEQFFRKVVGARREFDLVDFKTRFSAAVVSEFSECFLNAVTQQGIAINEFDLKKKRIGKLIGEILSEKFDKSWGIGLNDFIIEHIGISAECKNAIAQAKNLQAEKERNEHERERREKEKTEERERAAREDAKNWEHEKFRLELEAKTEADRIYAMAKSASTNREETHCPKCGYSYSAADSFCPKCGSRLRPSPCPDCGRMNEPTTNFCAGCGKKL